jgi:hypothetical protein
MPFQLELKTDSLWHAHLTTPLTWDEYDNGIEEIAQYLQNAPATIYIIMLVSAKLPAGNPLPHLRHAKQRLSNDNLRLCIIVAEPPSWLFRFLQNLVITFGLESTQFPRVDTLDEAQALIAADQARNLPA